MLQLLRMIPSNHYFLTAENGGKYNNTKQIIPFNTILATKKYVIIITIVGQKILCS